MSRLGSGYPVGECDYWRESPYAHAYADVVDVARTVGVGLSTESEKSETGRMGK